MISDEDKSNIVYKINRGDCDSSYIGEPSKPVCHCRAVESMNFSSSALAVHAWEHSHHIDWTSVSVLEVDSHYYSGRQSTSTEHPLPSIGIGVLCLIYMTSSYCDIAFYHLKPQSVASHTTERPITVVFINPCLWAEDYCNAAVCLSVHLFVCLSHLILLFKLE